MVWLMNFLADKFGNSAILKGGMELRLLDCPRYTNDIDYVFVPFSSKKDVGELVYDALRKIPDLRVEYSLNSKCIRFLCQNNSMHVQLEINVAENCESQELTTASLAKQHNLQGRIVRGMRFDIALAHKIAAWNERNLIRDLYDCYFMTEILSVRPHKETLERRLAKTEARIGSKTKRMSMTIADLSRKLKDAAASLSSQAVEVQMQDFFAPEQLPGLDKKIKIGLKKLIDVLDGVDMMQRIQ